MPARWKVLSSKVLLSRWWITLREDHVRLGNGTELEEFHVLEYPDWVCVVCLTDDRELLLVEQYRHGIEKIVMELPAGVVGRGEDAILAAKRELLEETGWEASNWVFLGRLATEPSRHTNWAHLYFASGARQLGAPSPEMSEDLHVTRLPVETVLRWADEGLWVHGVQLSALLLAERRGLLR